MSVSVRALAFEVSRLRDLTIGVKLGSTSLGQPTEMGFCFFLDGEIGKSRLWTNRSALAKLAFILWSSNSVAYGLITSAVKLAIKLTIKLKSYCSYNKEHFVVATTKCSLMYM